jgi:protein-tyrosine-phosphatase
MAEGLLRQALESRGVDATVASTGTSFTGRPASAFAVEVLRRRGIDIDDHRSRVLDSDQLKGADLVLCMERAHLREAAVLHAPALPRVFTLKEVVRRGETIGRRLPEETVEHWVGRAGLGRKPQDVMGDSPDDDVADPIGQPLDDYKATADELANLVDRLVTLIWPPLVRAVATESIWEQKA